MTVSTSYGVGRIIASQGDTMWMPRLLEAPKPILWFPGGAGGALNGLDGSVEPGLHSLLYAICALGGFVVACEWDFHAYGNATLMGHIETARSSLLGPLGTTLGYTLDTSKVVVVGTSQGAVDAYRYAQTHPSTTAACATIAGISDLTGFYTGVYRWGGDLGTAVQSDIGTAWGVTYPTPLPSDADPYDNASLMAAIPTWIGWSAADTTVTKAQCQAMVTTLGANAQGVEISASSPHGDGEAGDAATHLLAEWLIAHAA